MGTNDESGRIFFVSVDWQKGRGKRDPGEGKED
jgi:hypothetical protein